LGCFGFESKLPKLNAPQENRHSFFLAIISASLSVVFAVLESIISPPETFRTFESCYQYLKKRRNIYVQFFQYKGATFSSTSKIALKICSLFVAVMALHNNCCETEWLPGFDGKFIYVHDVILFCGYLTNFAINIQYIFHNNTDKLTEIHDFIMF
jgi:hypothetical protein